ncbi:MAG: hypothetical protein H7841_17900, partial [Magnetospirillum sp. WYHS-4]
MALRLVPFQGGFGAWSINSLPESIEGGDHAGAALAPSPCWWQDWRMRIWLASLLVLFLAAGTVRADP